MPETINVQGFPALLQAYLACLANNTYVNPKACDSFDWMQTQVTGDPITVHLKSVDGPDFDRYLVSDVDSHSEQHINEEVGREPWRWTPSYNGHDGSQWLTWWSGPELTLEALFEEYCRTDADLPVDVTRDTVTLDTDDPDFKIDLKTFRIRYCHRWPVLAGNVLSTYPEVMHQVVELIRWRSVSIGWTTEALPDLYGQDVMLYGAYVDPLALGDVVDGLASWAATSKVLTDASSRVHGGQLGCTVPAPGPQTGTITGELARLGRAMQRVAGVRPYLKVENRQRTEWGVTRQWKS